MIRVYEIKNCQYCYGFLKLLFFFWGGGRGGGEVVDEVKLSLEILSECRGSPNG